MASCGADRGRWSGGDDADVVSVVAVVVAVVGGGAGCAGGCSWCRRCGWCGWCGGRPRRGGEEPAWTRVLGGRARSWGPKLAWAKVARSVVGPGDRSVTARREQPGREAFSAGAFDRRWSRWPWVSLRADRGARLRLSDRACPLAGSPRARSPRDAQIGRIVVTRGRSTGRRGSCTNLCRRLPMRLIMSSPSSQTDSSATAQLAFSHAFCAVPLPGTSLGAAATSRRARRACR